MDLSTLSHFLSISRQECECTRFFKVALIEQELTVDWQISGIFIDFHGFEFSHWPLCFNFNDDCAHYAELKILTARTILNLGIQTRNTLAPREGPFFPRPSSFEALA